MMSKCKRVNMKMRKAGLLLSLLFLFTPYATGNNYVPPPTGPYQSSVVINSVEKNSVEQPQIYKFPSADLIHQDSQASSIAKRLPAYPVDRSYPGSAPMFKSEQIAPVTNKMPATSPGYQSQPMVNAQPSGPAAAPYSPYANNPWSAEQSQGFSQSPEQSVYQGDVWSMPAQNYSPRGYPNQYPYGYSNSYNSNPEPYTGMPTPWSVMPMKQFFSGQ